MFPTPGLNNNKWINVDGETIRPKPSFGVVRVYATANNKGYELYSSEATPLSIFEVRQENSTASRLRMSESSTVKVQLNARTGQASYINNTGGFSVGTSTAPPTSGLLVSGDTQLDDTTTLFPTARTFTSTASPDPLISFSSTITQSTTGGLSAFPAGYDFSGTLIAGVSIGGLGSGILFFARPTLKNATGTTVTSGAFYGYAASTAYTADGGSLGVTFGGDFISQPSFSTSGGGTLTVGAALPYFQFAIAGFTIGSGASVITRIMYGAIADATGAGTLTNNYGVWIPALTKGATLNVGGRFDVGSTVALWVGGSAAGTTATAGIMFGSGRDVNLYRSAADTLKTDDNLIVAAAGTAANSVATIDATQTLTNKRVTPRVGTVTSSATPTINTDNVDAYSITALAADITSMTTNLSGTPTDFQKLIIRILDDGTPRAITWGASFASKGATLPTTTTASKLLTVGLIYNSVTSLWESVAVAEEA